MIRREIWIPLAVAGLTIAFALVSWLVRVSRGHPWLVRRKLRLGGLLLTLTWAAAGCNDPVATCYVPLLPDVVYFDDKFLGESGLVLDLAEGHELTGEILHRASPAFAFQFLTEEGAEIQRGDVVATDGAFDESTEEFRLVLDPSGLPAEGTLKLYHGSSADIDPDQAIDVVHLTVIAAP